MKKAFIFLTIIFLYKVNFAQTSYNKMLLTDTTTWQHFGKVFGVKSSITSTINITVDSWAAIDTITIGSYIYKKVFFLSMFSNINYTGKQLKGYIREDSTARKVYFKESTILPEFVLYDFSLSVGDSTFMNFPNSPSFDGFYRVDSIITKTEICGPRKHFYYRKHVGNPSLTNNYFDFIESIGSTYHFLYRYNTGLSLGFYFLPPSCIHKWDLGLSCKKNKLVQQFQSCTYSSSSFNNFTNSCEYYYFVGGVKNNYINNSIIAYPNPTNEKLTLRIESSNNDFVTIKLIDVLGKVRLLNKNIALTGNENIIEVNTSTLENGIYSILIDDGYFTNKSTIVIQK